jgi:hypothetical protein
VHAGISNATEEERRKKYLIHKPHLRPAPLGFPFFISFKARALTYCYIPLCMFTYGIGSFRLCRLTEKVMFIASRLHLTLPSRKS